MRLRTLTLLICAMALGLTALSLPARAATPVAPPMFSPAEIIPADQIKGGMTGYGLSVFKGTKPERFNCTVIGVLRKWDFNADLIMIRITSGPVVTRKWGIIAGMSGSPIYFNGKLAGALAYAWSFSKEPIAGVTPIRQMAENFSPGAMPRPVSAGSLLQSPATAWLAGSTLVPRNGPLHIGGRAIERAQILFRRPAAASSDPHTMTLVPVATPLMVSGLSGGAIAELGKVLEPYGLAAMPGGGKSPVKLASQPKPGDAIGVQLVGGDIDLTAVGTVTYVNRGRILAMGHPFMGTGSIDLPIVNAYVHGILSNMESSFKLASAGDTIIGRWTQDRPWSLGGVLGQAAPTFPGAFSLWDKERGLHKQYRVRFGRHRQLTPILAAGVVGSAIDSIAPSGEGTLETDLTVAAQGLPVMHRKNIYSRPNGGGGDLLFVLLGGGGGSPTSDAMMLLDALENNSFGPVLPERVELRAIWTRERRAAAIEEARARVKRVRPGDRIPIEVLIQPWGKPKETQVIEVEVPRNAPPGRLQVGIAGGLAARAIKARLQISDPSPTNFAQEWDLYAKEEKNNDLLVEVALESSGLELNGRQLPNLPQFAVEVIQSANVSGVRVIRDHVRRTSDMPYVLSGGEVLSFIVETDEKEKAGRAPSVSAPSAEMGLPGGLLKGILESEGSEGEAIGEIRQVDEQDNEPDDAGASPSGEDAAATTPPEMPSWDEVSEVESQQAESTPGEKPTEQPKGKSILRSAGIWEDTLDKDFTKGKTFGTAVSTSGEVRLAPQARTLYSATDGLLWAEAADGRGNLYVGSWADGRVRRISSQGVASVVFISPDVAVQSLAFDAAGNLYAGTAPSGTIYRITAQGRASEFAHLPAPYIWALLADEKGLLAATGPEGKLFRIGADGKPQLLFQAPDRFVIALAAGPQGVVYAATYPKGKIYRITGDKVEPFYETVAGVTALSLAVDQAGNLIVGTSPEGRVIVVDPQGKSRLLYRSPERHIFALRPAPDGSVYAATGPRGRIYRLLPDGNAEVVWEAKVGHVLAMVENAGVLQANLAGARQIIDLDLTGGSDGTFVSQVFDASGPSKWGQLRWQADMPEGTSLTLQTRSGNTGYPDATWSDWSAPYPNPTGENITSPDARYLQYQATLRSTNAQRPALREVETFYMTHNRPPELKLLAPVQSPLWSGKKSIKWSATDPDKDTLAYEVFYSGDQGKTWTKIEEPVKKEEKPAEAPATTPAPAEAAATEPAEKTEKPTAQGAETNATAEPAEAAGATEEKGEKRAEPAEDTTTTTTPPKAAAERPAPTPMKATSMTWDTTKVTDGVYIIRVVASDRQSSPEGGLSDTRVTEPFRIDNTPPTIQLEKAKEPVAPPTKVAVSDSGTYVASVEYRVDKGDWKGAVAEDGIYDAQSEAALIAAAELPAGQHTLQLRARDGVGNEATGEVKYSKP